MSNRSDERVVYCQFCGRDNNDLRVQVMLDAGSATICNVCVSIAAQAIKDHIHTGWLKTKDLAP
jgi:ribosome-binding protein aMBF1 (putative translation factor)